MELRYTRLVILLVLVTLSSLTVFTNGSETRFSCGTVDLTFILDQSESIRDEDPPDQPDYTWNLIKTFIKDVIDKLPVSQAGVNVALMKYAQTAKVEWNLGHYNYPNDIFAAIDDLECEGGNTNTALAFRTAYEDIYRYDPRSHVRNVIVILTDGMSTIDSYKILTEVDKLMQLDNTEIYAVAVGKYVDEDELKTIVHQRYSKYLMYVEDYDRLADFEELLARSICNLPPILPNRTDCEREKMDLTFLVDSSGSIKEARFWILKQFIAEVASRLEIGPDKTKVAAVTFSDIATLEFRLGDYTDKEDLLKKLKEIKFENGNTNTSGGFRVAMQEVFFGSPGDRKDVTDVLVLITDGASTLEQNNTIPTAHLAKSRGIQVYGLGVTDKVNVKELQNIVSKPIREHFFESPDVETLSYIFVNLLKNICSQSSV